MLKVSDCHLFLLILQLAVFSSSATHTLYSLHDNHQCEMDMPELNKLVSKTITKTHGVHLRNFYDPESTLLAKGCTYIISPCSRYNVDDRDPSLGCNWHHYHRRRQQTNVLSLDVSLLLAVLTLDKGCTGDSTCDFFV